MATSLAAVVPRATAESKQLTSPRKQGGFGEGRAPGSLCTDEPCAGHGRSDSLTGDQESGRTSGTRFVLIRERGGRNQSEVATGGFPVSRCRRAFKSSTDRSASSGRRLWIMSARAACNRPAASSRSSAAAVCSSRWALSAAVVENADTNPHSLWGRFSALLSHRGAQGR